jgi:hypothetical protein
MMIILSRWNVRRSSAGFPQNLIEPRVVIAHHHDTLVDDQARQSQQSIVEDLHQIIDALDLRFDSRTH